ncbi:MAG TPA: rod shape-determining protein MreD [Oscillospiraceae bacterium]|nr:rod shape-determining protein MreD [Oscillospiraceae bacterium]
MEKRYKILRYFAYAIEILIVFIIQETPNLIPAVFGARPVLLIPVALSIAMFESETAAMGFGLFCGLLVDFGAGNVLGFHGLLLTVMCYMIGLMVINLLRTNLITAFFVTAVALAIIFLLQWVFFFVLAGYQGSGYALFTHYLPKYGYTLILMPIAYYFNRAFALLLKPKEE